MNKYKDYFNIDKDFFPSVNEELLDSGLVDWTKFYPHSTFVGLLKDTASILRREQKLSIWVEGSYGTGKSYAALTLKKLIDASESEAQKYFIDYNLDMDLFNKIQGAKNQGEILTVHRYGSSSIKGDDSLVMTVQESIKKAILQKDALHKCDESLKGSIIKKLMDPVFARFFDHLILERYQFDFGSDDSKNIINKLEKYNEEDVADLIRRIFMVAEKEGITAFKLDVAGLIEWIKNVISQNNLKSIIFIWDEFTDYFKNNENALTGFQQLIELSATAPFHFVIVTHKSGGLFHDKDSNKSRILDRFVKPTCNIELPENMAFKLMGKAMRKSDDELVKKEWEGYADDLNAGLSESSELVMKSAKIDLVDLKRILPIHPYTAIMLKHLSSMFNSNHRSMFEFLKNRKDDKEDRSFQWYIENFGPNDDCNLLTIDMLWEYFYAGGKANLESSIKNLLSVYENGSSQYLNDECKRVFKTILLLQGISEKSLDSVELFRPTANNIGNAYEGTDLGGPRAVQIAERLIKDRILFKQPIGNGQHQFVAMRSGSNEADISDKIKEYRESKKLKDIVDSYNVEDFMALSGALKLRFEVKTATIDNVTRVANEIRNRYFENTLPVVLTFAKDDSERSALIGKIRELVKSDDQQIIWVDTSLCDLTNEAFEEYIKNLAECDHLMGKDNGSARKYNEFAEEVIKKWKVNLANADIRIIIKNSEQKVFGVNDVYSKLKEINQKVFPFGIENYNVAGTMFDPSSLKLGAKCGISEIVSHNYRSANEATKLENALKGAWGIKEYWTSNKSILISRIKADVDSFIEDEFSKNGKVTIRDIYDRLKAKPYGFLYCNLSAFILGFLLKEYACDTYSWSNDQVSELMSVDKMAEMIDEILKLQSIPNNRYIDKYIVKKTIEEKKFLKITALVFGINESQCATIEKTRNQVRAKMKELGFPIWAIKWILDENKPDQFEKMKELIDLYCSLANNNGTEKSEIDIVTAIGTACINNAGLPDRLKQYVNSENCRAGMIMYINQFSSGELKDLAAKINDGGNAIIALKNKANAAESAWLWKQETIDSKIEELILEYKIINVSNKFITSTTNFKELPSAWCEKLRFFRLPYDGIKNDIGELKELFDCLIEIVRTVTIGDMIKVKFLEQLEINGEKFTELFANQVLLFKKKCEFELHGLGDEDIQKVFKTVALGSFIKANSEYQTTVGQNIATYKKSLKINELRELWQTKTGTSTPSEWSEKYQTPILCLIEKDYIKAKSAFDTLNKKTPDETDILKAIEYLNSADIFENLKSESVRDKAFMDKVVGDFNTLINDVTNVRSTLSTRMYTGVYEWYQNPDVKTILEQYAENIYQTTGCEMVLSKIEDMDPQSLKNYLKRLVRDNIKVGMEIMKDN